MKSIYRNALGLVAVTLAVTLTGCGKDAPVSFVDGYTPAYTEAEGTLYEGSYFPIDEGNSWTYTGTGEIKGTMTMKAMGQSENEFIDEMMSLESDMTVLPEESISLASGSYDVYPLQESAFMDDGMSGGETKISNRYFENSNGTIFIRAIKTDEGSIIEIENPVFIKHPLKVGDSWEASPYFDIESVLGISDLDFSDMGGETPDIDMSIISKFYVVGKETMQYDGASVATVRLDQKSEATVKMNIPEMGPITINMKITSNLNFAEDIGIVYQKDAINMTMSGSLSMDGVTVNFSMNMTMNDNMNLDTHAKETGSVAVVADKTEQSITKRKNAGSSLGTKLADAGVPPPATALLVKAVSLSALTTF